MTKIIYTTKQYVELFHLLFLDQLGRKMDKNLYALKGGCNLRFYFNSIRYSEDIDIDINTIQLNTLQNKVQKILESNPFKQILRASQIEILQISASKQTETTQRWKILLKVPSTQTPIHTKIEFSRRNMEADIVFSGVERELIQTYHLTPIFANHYSANVAFQQKIQALIFRTQTQARDVFDLYLLLHREIDLDKILNPLKDQLSEACKNALSIDFETFKGQVLAYLPPEYQDQYNSKSVWEEMVTTVTKALSQNL